MGVPELDPPLREGGFDVQGHATQQRHIRLWPPPRQLLRPHVLLILLRRIVVIVVVIIVAVVVVVFDQLVLTQQLVWVRRCHK